MWLCDLLPINMSFFLFDEHGKIVQYRMTLVATSERPWNDLEESFECPPECRLLFVCYCFCCCRYCFHRAFAADAPSWLLWLREEFVRLLDRFTLFCLISLNSECRSTCKDEAIIYHNVYRWHNDNISLIWVITNFTPSVFMLSQGMLSPLESSVSNWGPTSAYSE